MMKNRATNTNPQTTRMMVKILMTIQDLLASTRLAEHISQLRLLANIGKPVTLTFSEHYALFADLGMVGKIIYMTLND